MKPLILAYLILAGVAAVTGEVKPELTAVGVPDAWIALVASLTSKTVAYIGALGAAGILAVPQIRTALEKG